MNTLHDFKEAVTKIQKLTPSAAVFARAHQLISSPDVQLEDLAKIIKLDTSLTADIIRLSNSGAIGGPLPTGSLQEAISRVGLREVDHFLGLSFSKNIINRDLQCYGISAFDYWSTSVSTAILMEFLAKRLRQDTGEAYTIGMLHATGRLVINQAIDDLGVGIFWDEKIPVETWEIESVGLTYATAGALLLKTWGFPESFCEIIENQLAPAQAPKPSKMLKLLNFALRLLILTGSSFKLDEGKLPESDSFLKEFGIGLDEVKEMLVVTQKKHAEAERMLQISR